MSEFHKDDIIFSTKHGQIAKIDNIVKGGIYKIAPLGPCGLEFFSNELKIEEIEPVHITSDFIDINSLYGLIYHLELYPFNSTENYSLYKLNIDYDKEGNKFHVQTIGKIKYVHELQQYLRKNGLKEIANNLKIGE